VATGCGGATNGSGGTSAGSGHHRRHRPTSKPNGVQTQAHPTLPVADFGPAPLGVPSFLIDQFSIQPFLLPIYQACGTQYGSPWEVLAGINRIETAFGTNLNVSTAGAVGWMRSSPPLEDVGWTQTATAAGIRTTRSTRSAPRHASEGGGRR
jgi:hypothetical protein